VLKNLGTMRFIVGRFTSFAPEIEFLPNHFLWWNLNFYKAKLFKIGSEIT